VPAPKDVLIAAAVAMAVVEVVTVFSIEVPAAAVVFALLFLAGAGRPGAGRASGLC
jgi:hypothetical protein